LKCNGDTLNGIALMYCTDNECLWVKFRQEFQQAFTDTTSEQRAYGKLANFAMGNKNIDEYIAKFKHLL